MSPMTTSSIIWYQPKAVMPVTQKVNVSMAESNGSVTDCQESGISSECYAQPRV